MFFIFTALNSEAKPIIEKLNLKKQTLDSLYNIYMDESKNVLLTVTNVGQIQMATAVSHILTLYKADKEDFVINIGSCAGKESGCFLVNKIIEAATKRTFFPDILYKHEFMEKTLVSGFLIKNSSGDLEEELYDMEGAAFYQSAVKYVYTDRIILIKVVSDDFSPDKLSANDLTDIINGYVEKIDSYIGCLRQDVKRPVEKFNDDDYLIRLSNDLKLSATLEARLKQLLNYLRLSQIEYTGLIEEYYKKEIIPCKDKKEGKLILDELQKRFI